MTDLPPPPPGAPPPGQGDGVPQQPGFSADPKQAKAQAKAAKAHSKAVRPWYKKKRFILGGIIALIVVISVAAGGGEKEKDDSATPKSSGATSAPVASDAAADEPEADEPTSTEAPAAAVSCKDAGPDDKLDTKNQDLYPDRADRQEDDHEVAVGDCARISGFTTFVDGSSVKPQDFGDSVFVVNVRLQNRDDKAQSFNMYDWSLLTPGGTVIDPTFTLDDDDLSSGDLVKGGEVTGNVPFAITEPGTYYVIYTPDPFSDDRAIWQVTI